MPHTPHQPGDITSWELTNAQGLAILGDTYTPTFTPTAPTTSLPKACVILLHGFMGYKNYGFIPVLAERLASRGVLVHTFNFACSGMSNETETFARPDLFEQDTWNGQVGDVRGVVGAVRSGELPGQGLPLWLIGHSRGGETSILAAGRHNSADTHPLGIAGVVAINAPADCNRLSDGALSQMLGQGYLEVRSGRTGQTLRLGRGWLDEQSKDPDGHNLERMAARIDGPLLVLQGDADDTVPISDAERIAAAAGTSPVILEHGTHVLNVPNPATEAVRADPGPVFEAACEAVLAELLKT